MAQHNVLLVCGSGASSGFMAANIRKAVKARGLDMKVAAKSESAVEDCVMAGPHLESTIGDIEEVCDGYPIKVAVMKPEYYAHLDGEAALDHILQVLGEE